MSMTVYFDEKTVADFREAMESRVKLLGETPKHAVSGAMRALLRGLRKRTGIAHRFRQVERNAEFHKGKRRRAGRSSLYKIIGHDGKAFVSRITKGRGGKPLETPMDVETVFAKSLAEAKANPRAKISKRGLARDSWGWAIKKLFKDQVDMLNPWTQPPQTVQTEFFSRDGLAQATVLNNLSYIGAAVEPGGVQGAYAAAAKSLNGYVKSKIEAATRGAGY